MSTKILIYKNDVEYDITKIVSLPITITETIDETLDSGSFNIPIIGEYFYLWDNGIDIPTSEPVSPIKGDQYFDEQGGELFTFNGISWYGVRTSDEEFKPTADNQNWFDYDKNLLYTSYSYDMSNRIERYSRVVIIRDERTFRFLVTEDKVEQIKKTTPTMYSHNVSLVEPTKLLERRTIPNITVTQPTGSTRFYTSSQLIIDYEVEGSLDNGNDPNKQIVPLDNITQSSDTAILDNNILKQVGEEYSISVDFVFWNDYVDTPFDDPDNYALVEVLVDGVLLPGNSWFERIPHKTLTTRRYAKGSINFKRIPTVINEAITVRVSALLPEAGLYGNVWIGAMKLSISNQQSTEAKQTNLSDTVDKILSINKISDINDTSYNQEIVLGDNTRGKIETILNPELSYQRTYAWEPLKEIAGIVKGIPRLGKDQPSGIDPFTTLEFDFVDELDEFLPIYDITNYTNLSKTAHFNDYVNGLKINADNVIEIESSINKKVEPFYNGWMSLRANEKGPKELTESQVGLKLNQKIYKISKVYVTGVPVNVVGGTNIPSSHVWDISDHIYESKDHLSLDDLDFTDTASRSAGVLFRGNTLSYSQGDNRIQGFGEVAKYEDSLLNGKLPKNALYEAIYTQAQLYLQNNSLAGTVDDTTNDSVINFEGVKFRVEYIPIQSIRATVMRQDARSFETESIRYLNESAQIIDSDNLGEYAKTTVNKLGNETYTHTGFSKIIDDVPQIGQMLSTGSIVTSRTIHIEKNIISWSIDSYDDYITISDFIGVDSKYRQWEVPDEDTVFRQDTYRDYLVLDKVDRKTDHNIYTSDALKLLFDNFIPGAASSSKYTPISYGVMRNRFDELNPGDVDWTTYDTQVDFSVNPSNIGTTLVLTSELDDNYSAGAKAESGVNSEGIAELTAGNPIADPDDYKGYYQQDTKYTDDFGKIDSCRIDLYTYGDNVKTWEETLKYPEHNTLDVIDGSHISSIDVRIKKDAREKYGWVQELNFSSDNPEIRVYSGIAKYNGFSAVKADVDIVTYILFDDYFPHPNETIIDIGKSSQVTLDTYTVNTIDDINGIRGYLDLSFTAPATTKSITGYAFVNDINKELIFAVKEPISTGSFSDTIFYVPNTKVGGYVDLTPTEVAISTPSQTIIEGDSLQLESQLTPFYAESDIIWSIDNITDFSIDANGLLTALDANGEASVTVTVTAIEGGLTGTQTFSSIPLIDTITFDQSNVITYMGWREELSGYFEEPETTQLSLTFTPTGNVYNDIVWSSDATNFVTVDQNGLLTAGSSPGTANITATSTKSGATASIAVENRIRAHTLYMIQSDFNLEINASSQLSYVLLPSNAYDDVVFGEIEDLDNLFTTTSTGLVTAIIPDPVILGDVIVQASSVISNLSDNITITSVKPNPTSIIVTADATTIEAGTTTQMYSQVVPSYAKEGVSWVEYSSYFEIDQTGLLTSLTQTEVSGPVTTTIYARSTADTNISGTLDITATPPPPTGITLIGSTKTEVESGKTNVYDYLMEPLYADDSLVSWSVTNTDWTITQNGYLTAPSDTSSTDLILDSGYGHTQTITVTATPPQIITININESDFERDELGHYWMAPDTSKQITYVLNPNNAVGDLVWSLQNFSSPSSVTQTGLFSIVGERVDTVKVRDNITTANDLIQIYSIYDEPSSFDIQGLTSMTTGTFQTLTINNVVPVSGDPKVSWSIISGSSYASIDQTGKITANVSGSVTVKAESTYSGSSTFNTFNITITSSAGGGCLDRNTLIPMWDGSYRRIRSIKPGDVVVGYTFNGMIDENTEGWEKWTTDDISTGRRVPATVKEILSDWYKEYYLINNDVKITKYHPLFAKNNDNVWGWVDSPDLQIGYMLLDEDGNEVIIESIEFIEDRLDVVTMNVEEVDTYFAGNNPVLVHNVLELEKQ